MREENYIDLVEKAMHKDLEAMAVLYNATCDLSYYIAILICNNTEDSLDITQGSYIKAFSNISRLKNPENFPCWIGRIVINQTKDLLMNNNKINFIDIDRTKEVDDMNISPNDYNADYRPEEVIEKKQTKKIIQEILDTLSSEQRLVTIMFFYEEMSIREIAHQLKCKENTIKSRLNYARKQIEDSVLNLEQHGMKLYGFLPIPFFQRLLRESIEDFKIPNRISEEILSEITHEIMSAGIAGASRFGLSSVLKSVCTKIIAGTLAGALVIGGLYYTLRKNNAPTIINESIIQTESTKDTSDNQDNTESNEVSKYNKRD